MRVNQICVYFQGKEKTCVNARETKGKGKRKMISMLELPIDMREAICEGISEIGLILLGLPTIVEEDYFE